MLLWIDFLVDKSWPTEYNNELERITPGEGLSLWQACRVGQSIVNDEQRIYIQSVAFSCT